MSAGRAITGIGTGVASGAAIGAFGGPVGAAIGGGVGGLLGGLSQLLQDSDDAKKRQQLRQQLQEQADNQFYETAIGLSGGDNSVFQAARWDPTSPEDINRQVDMAMPEQEPDWGAFLQSIAGAAGATRSNMRANALEEELARKAGNLRVGGGNGSLGGYWGGGR